MRSYLLLLLLFITTIVAGQIPKPKKNTYVNDLAKVLSKEDIKRLNQKIYIIEKENAAQLAIVLVNKIPAKYTIKQYANLIGKKWHVGKNKRGMVYVAAIAEHKQQLVVATNLDSIITGEVSDNILASMKTAYRQQDYAGGLTILVNGIHETFSPKADVPVEKTKPQEAVATTEKDVEMGALEFWFKAFLWIGGIVIVWKIVKRIFGTGSRSGRYPLNNGYQGNYPPDYGQPGYGGRYSSPGRSGGSSGWGRVLGGAALGAAAGYAARAYQDRNRSEVDAPSAGDSNYGRVTGSDSFRDKPITEDNNQSNWGNWDTSGSDDNGFSDTSSSDSSSSDDSGFSDSGSSDSGDSGGNSSW